MRNIDMKNSGFRRAILAAALAIGAIILPMNVALGQSGLLLADHPDSYTIEAGDTLWNIASQFLQDPQRWSEVWKPDEYLDNSELIYPGDTLIMSTVEGAPRILVQRGDRDIVALGPEVREEPLLSAIPAIPLESIENSFTRNRIANMALYQQAPYIVANLSASLVIGTGDEVYARGTWPDRASSFEVYREGTVYPGPNKDEPLGIEFEYLGFASITESVSDDLKKLLINNSSKEIQVGDRLLIREESRIGATIFPVEPSSEVAGQIIDLVDSDAKASQLDTVVINLGLRDNIEVGNVLSIQQAGDRVIDEVERGRMTFRERFQTFFNPAQLQLPGKEIGTLLIYKTFDELSYGVILSSTEPAEVANMVVNP